MAAEERRPPGDLSPAASPDEARALETARRTGFRALMLAIDRLRPGAASALGGAASAHEEQVRFRHDPSLGFATADVASVREVSIPADPGTGAPPRPALQITTAFLGLTGQVSPLPSYIAEEIAQEVAEEREPPRRREFLDLFHHRAISFLHRAGAKHDVAAGALSDQSDAWSRRLLALLGRDELPGAAAEDDAGEPPWRLLRYAPLLAERALTAAALEACLADAFAPALRGARVEIEQFAGSWVALADDERTRLGASASELGRSFVLGGQVFDRAGRFRVVLGPLDASGYARLSAPEAVRAVRRAVSALAGDGLDVDVVLRLAPGAAPGLLLSATAGARLGRNAWLGRQAAESRVTVGAEASTPTDGAGPSRPAGR